MPPADVLLQKFTCSACGVPDVTLFLEQQNVPTHVGIQWPTTDEARNCPRGDILLGFCQSCGLIMNVAYDPHQVDYGQAYDNALDASPLYRSHAHEQAERLVEVGDLHDKTIIEIGCGKGNFLKRLCDMGGNQGIGFDPTAVERPDDIKNDPRLRFIADAYSQQYEDYQADLICCRHVLEHIPHPKQFLSMLRKMIGKKLDTRLYFEVPNLKYMIDDVAIWTIIYEHCSYFGQRSLARLFAACGFTVTHLAETFENQFLTIEAVPAKHIPAAVEGRYDTVETTADAIICFVDRCTRKLRYWRSQFAAFKKGRRKVVMWGAGARAVTFLNVLNVTDQIPYVVDINPRKEGMYLPGTAQQIVAPSFLAEYRPDTIIIMNGIYRDEIQNTVKDLGIKARYLIA